MNTKFDFSNYEITEATIEDAEQVAELEKRSYAEDEAADLDKMKLRIKEARDYFLILRLH